MTCPKCGKENGDGDRFCGACGAPLEAPATPVGDAPEASGAPAQAVKAPIPAKTVIIAVVALLAIGGGALAYRSLQKNDEASVTLQVGDDKITIGTEDVERAARAAAEEAERIAEEAERIGRETSEVAERAAEDAAGASNEERAGNVIRGKIVELGWKKYVVRSFDTGKSYTINVGRVTTYNQRRKAAVGDQVTATIKYEKGRIIGTRIDFD